MDKFGEFIGRWSLIDSPLKGAKYTWSNCREVPSLSRLDRFLYFIEWEELFPRRSQSSLPRLVSDHSPIVLESVWGKGGPSPFKVEEVWFNEPDFMDLVKQVWTQTQYSGNPSRIFALKLKNLKSQLKAWSNLSVEYFKEECKKCLVKIKEIDLLEESRSLSQEERVSRDLCRKEFMIIAVK